MKFLFTTLFVMSYLTLHAKVIIGDVFFDAINSFEVEQSIENTSDVAKITLARNYKNLADKKVLDYIKAGSPVTILCGYDGDLQTEFTGFIKPNISADYPIHIECDELFFLRQNNHIISERSMSLKQLLQRIAPTYTVECLDVQLGKVLFSNESTVQILEKLKKDWGFYSRIHNNTLHVGFAFDFKPSFTQRYTYTIGSNVRDFKKLKFATDTDFKTQIKVKIHRNNGKTEEIVYGMKDVNGEMQAVKIGGGKTDKVVDEKGTMKTYEVSHLETAEVEKMAKAQLKRIIYAGYKGSIDGFCVPRTKAGDSLQIIDIAKPEREGTYLIEKVIVKYGDAKIERENFISYKVA